MDPNLFTEIAQYLDATTLGKLCQTSPQYLKYCSDPRIRNMYLANKIMTRDVFYQIAQHLDTNALALLCASNARYFRYCGETRFRVLFITNKFQPGLLYQYVLSDESGEIDHSIGIYNQVDGKTTIVETVRPDIQPLLPKIFNPASLSHRALISKNYTQDQLIQTTDYIDVFLPNSTPEDIKRLLTYMIEQTNIDPLSFEEIDPDLG